MSVIKYDEGRSRKGFSPFVIVKSNGELDLVELGNSIKLLFTPKDDGNYPLKPEKYKEFFSFLKGMGIEITDEDKLDEFLDDLANSENKLLDMEVINETSDIIQPTESILKVGGSGSSWSKEREQIL